MTVADLQPWLDKLADLRQRIASADYARLRGELNYQAGFLAGLACAAALLLGIGNGLTQSAIAARLDEDMQASLQQVLPVEGYDNQPLHDVLTLPANALGVSSVYRARRNGQINAVAFRLTAPDGYSGDIHLLMGVGQNGQLLGVRVIAHAETPGLGDKIEAAKSTWIQSFNGRTLDNTRWAVKKDGGDFDQFAGATITPRAVVKRVRLGLEFFQQQRDTLLDSRP